MAKEVTESTFLREVSQHSMTVIRDDGVNRHLRFRRPETNCMGFDLITWAGHLCYTGDMGTYVFSRIEDMFEFFRSRDGALRINRSYWAEKCDAQDRADGITEYSAERFRQVILEWAKDVEVADFDGGEAEFMEAIKDEVLSVADHGEAAARRAVDDFEHQGFRFTDFFETNLREYTHRFVWCCYALVWGIRQYDALAAKAAA